MIILGTKPVQHDACFALLKDGEPVFVYEQERFNRVKHGMSSDLSTLFEALREHSVDPGQIDLVTQCIDPARLDERKRQTRGFLDGPAAEETERHLDWRLPTWRRSLIAAGFPADRVVDIRHHLCHAAGVYYASPFQDAAILSVDGSGETETAMLAHGSGNDIRTLRTTPHPQSLGHLYQAVTFWLGWGFGEEGKTMALAGYGDPDRFRKRLEEFVPVAEDGSFAFTPGFVRPGSRYTSEEIKDEVLTGVFGPPRRAGEPLSSVHQDAAAAVQAVCEDIMLRSARFLKERTGSRNLLVTGGVALNSVSNGVIMRSGLFDRVVVYPQANDSGTALGGALYAHHRLGDRERRRVWFMEHAYWGRHIDTENVEKAAATFGQQGSRVSDVVRAAARLLADGRTVGWVQGRSEIGPRSLGNRSILGNPLVDGIKQRINDGIKHRENWRPFAPSVLREDLSTYFEADQDLPYMTVVAEIRPQWRTRLASIGHVDGTARVQTVTERSNPRFHALLKAFKELTGVGVLLNTSFNDRGEPLVQTSEQALRLYTSSEMDALCIGDWLFTDKRTFAARPFAPCTDNFAKLPGSRLLLLEDRTRMPAEMRAHLLRLHPGLVVADAAQDDVADLRAEYDAAVRYVDRTADAFIFDRSLYFSATAETSRQIMREAGIPVYWIDRRGDVVPARDVLYVHHDTVDCPVPSSYEGYWNRGR
ncbi:MULTISPECIES: carbamoyltransferase family protein [unclassified Streptomyces]|uniref:carbamoyltransferase family protein n=1 Tax=unclassified Streptomyces TaxID=2593676 RepID=UPI001318AEB3|nr:MULTISPECIES: carbamoyltransferase C-terminal domain-containing protein [unclassified Streptomyces]QHC31814.1 carbamoyltransferase [Streptomyces sp. HF10]WKE69209.1 carbamoyltransferase C-terminal domain-containing protein [Streptomyces sp. WP-1]